jgi:hypothetical protein
MGWLVALLRAILPFFFATVTKPASAVDADAPADLKEDLNDQINDLPPTPDE